MLRQFTRITIMTEKDLENKEPTFADKVNEVVGQLVQNEDGKWELPENVEADEQVLYTATIEKRRRTDQAAFTKSRQENARLKATNKKLATHMVENATLHLTDTQREELEDLKVSDPEEWRKKITEYETQSRTILSDKISELEKEGSVESMIEARELQFKQFTEDTGIELTDEIVDNELPAIYKKQLDSGEIDFAQFLAKAEKFLTGGKVIKDAEEPAGDPPPNLGEAAGGPKPSEAAQEKDIISSYKDEIY